MYKSNLTLSTINSTGYRIQNLMESEHWIQLIDLAIERVRTFYKRGDLYAELLSKNYLTGVVYRVDEIIESLGLERSVYYNRRQEAVLLFGYALWAIVIPREKVNARTESGG